MKNYSTSQVARMVGIDKQTLLRWLWAGKVSEPKQHSNGGVKVRLWNERDPGSVPSSGTCWMFGRCCGNCWARTSRGD